jgi:hypothetical protein
MEKKHVQKWGEIYKKIRDENYPTHEEDIVNENFDVYIYSFIKISHLHHIATGPFSMRRTL